MQLKTLLATAALAAAAMAAGGAQATAVQNGSFELGVFDGAANPNGAVDDTDVLAAGSLAITGWTVTGSGVAWIGPSNDFGLSASNGSFFLDLTSYNDAAPYGGVTQTVLTNPGETYVLSFDLGSSTNYGVPDSITATAGGSTQTFTSTNTTSANAFQTETLSFTASGPTTAITLTGAGANPSYIGLDNVSVSAAPEPATWALMIVGVGLVGGVLRRKPFGGMSAATA